MTTKTEAEERPPILALWGFREPADGAGVEAMLWFTGSRQAYERLLRVLQREMRLAPGPARHPLPSQSLATMRVRKEPVHESEAVADGAAG